MAVAALSLEAVGAAESSRQYGAGAPFEVSDLPQGPLRSSLEALPGQARSRALDWLHTFTFPAADAGQLRADPHGGIFYVDPQAADGPTEPGSTASTTPSVAEVFALHSKPGASRKIFVDFDGHVITGRAWNSGRADPLYAKAYDTDGDPLNFSESERSAIAEMWYRIAEDYAAFDVDVTTEDPGIFDSQTGHILITDDEDEYNNAMPAQGAGGVAYVNAWGSSNYGYYSPALVYADNLGPDFPPYIAEAATHEMGHNLGLSHDGGTDTSYYSGHGSGWVSWGPIMGTGYGDNVSQWSKGEYAGANNQQDDIAIISGKLTGRADDHGDDASSSTLLNIGADGSVSSTHPESDPFNNQPGNKGIIDFRGDVDVFLISAGAGTIDLSVVPSWAAWPRSSGGRGTNLDVQATLYDDGGTVLATSDPLDNTDARISVSVGGGVYSLAITGVGNSISPYSDYASQGQYFISGYVPPGEPDTVAPNPNPMTWSSVPQATGPDSMTMTATTATDDSGGDVFYYFACVAGGAGCVDSGWQASANYQATGLAADTLYEWQVKARDLAGNATAFSLTASAFTQPAPQPPAAPTDLTATDAADGSALLSWTDASDNESGFEIQRETYHPKRRRWQSTNLVGTAAVDATSWTDVSGAGIYRYRVRAVNAVGSSAYTPWVEVTVSDGTGGGGGKGGGNGGGGGDNDCKGGPKKCPA